MIALDVYTLPGHAAAATGGTGPFGAEFNHILTEAGVLVTK